MSARARRRRAAPRDEGTGAPSGRRAAPRAPRRARRPRGSARSNSARPSLALLLRSLPGRRRLQGERMHALGNFLLEQRINHAVALDAPLAGETRRRHFDAVMGLPAGARAAVAGVEM